MGWSLLETDSSRDLSTAEGFADYFRTIGEGSRYTEEQFRSFFAPVDPESLTGRTVAELGFGHGSFLEHVLHYRPAHLSGVDLGDVVEATRRKLAPPPGVELNLQRGDLTQAELGPHDFVYCMGVLHHLQEPVLGFEAVLRHVTPGGRFHCWIYSKEGNFWVIHGLDVVRKLSARLPWWAVKWGPGLAIALLFFAYTKLLTAAERAFGASRLGWLPLVDYARSVADRDFTFFHFLATDFLVARRTVYLDRASLEAWLGKPEIEPGSTYLIHRNGNSWSFGGHRC